MSHHSSLFDSYSIRRQRPPKNKIGTGVKHDSAISHVMGTATYVDDMLKPQNTLHLAIGKSTHAHARIVHMDLSGWSMSLRFRICLLRLISAQCSMAIH